MPALSKRPFGILSVSPHRIADLLEELREMLQDQALTPRTILYINAHVYNLACRDEELRKRLDACRINAADGMAVVWASSCFGPRLAERCNMTEAFRAFLQASMPPSRAILIGCSEEDAAAAAQRINADSRHCRILQSYSGFLNDAQYEAVFRAHSGIDFVFFGMGTPRTEWLTQLAERSLPRAIIWAIGGGTIRIYAGQMQEAPPIWRRLGLQWLHRLASEPGALWRRYLVGNPVFMFRILQAVWRYKWYGR